MVQVMTVSAATAAYAAEALRPSARVSGVASSDKPAQSRATEARKTSGDEQVAPARVIQPPAIGLFFLTAQKQPDSTLQRARQQYLDLIDDHGNAEDEAGEYAHAGEDDIA
jgi:hypothetical protein